MRNFILMIFLICLFFSYSDAKETCITEKCHSGMGKEKYVHGPIAVGECLMCHNKIGQHKFIPITGSEKLCYKCHPDRIDTTKEVHKQINSNCTSCHSPHQSSYKYQLKKEKM